MKKIILITTILVFGAPYAALADVNLNTPSQAAVAAQKVILGNDALMLNDTASRYVGYALTHTINAKQCLTYWPDNIQPTTFEVAAYNSDCTTLNLGLAEGILTQKDIDWVFRNIPVWEPKPTSGAHALTVPSKH